MISYFYQRYSRVILAGVVLTFPLLFSIANSIRSNNDIETWLPRDTGVRQAYEEFKQDFGCEEVVVIACRDQTEDRRLVEALADRLERSKSVRCCWTARRLQTQMASFGVPEDISADRLRGLLISEDQSFSAVFVCLNNHGLHHRQSLVAEVREAIAYCQFSPKDLAITGAPIIVTELDRLGAPEANAHLVAVSILISTALLYMSFGHWGMSLSVMGLTLWSIYATQTLLVFMGGEMNFIMGSLSMMVMIFTLSISIHFVSYFSSAVCEGSQNPLGAAFWESLRPCWLSSVTTLLGLMALNVSSILPVSQFGYAAALGAVVSLIVGLGITPAIMTFWPRFRARPFSIFRMDFAAWGAMIARQRKKVLVATLAGLVFTGIGISRLQSKVNPVDFLPRNSQVVTDFEQIRRDFTDIDSIEIVADLSAQADDAFLDKVARVRAIEKKVAAVPGIRHTLSLATFFPETFDGSIASTMRILDNAQSSGNGEGLIADNQRQWRISARVRFAKGNESADVIRNLTLALAGEPVRLTGLTPLLDSAQREIFAGFWQSFAAAVATISLVMVLALRSISKAIVAMIPNIIPIWLVFGMVGFFDVPVDIGMMMTGSIALGISVDNTFHFLVKYQLELGRGGSAVKGCQEALCHSGEPMLESTMISSMGMLALCMSSFVPTVRFGAMMSGQMVVSIIGELILLPSLLCLISRDCNASTTPEPAGDADSVSTTIQFPTSQPRRSAVKSAQ